MNVREPIILGLISLSGGLSLLGADAAHAASPVAPFEEKHIVEGDWQASFGEGSLEFRFELENGSWRGWFVSQKDGSLHPVQNLEVYDDVVTFTHVSEPKLDFRLQLTEDKQALSGIFTLPNGMSIPQTLRRI